MTSYGPHARVVVAGIRFTEVHDEWNESRYHEKATPGQYARVVTAGDAPKGQLDGGDEVAMDFPVCVGKASHRTPLYYYALRKRQGIMFPILYDAPCLTSCG